MRRFALLSVASSFVVAGCHSATSGTTTVRPAADRAATGPYSVLKRARVGGEGGTDYIYADVAGRRLYIPRGGFRAVAATDSTPAKPAIPGRVTVFDLETLAPVGEIQNGGGNGVAVD